MIMKKLSFLLGCVLLLLVATAVPAMADPLYYQVYVYDGSAAWIDESTTTWGPVDAVPVGADVRISTSWVALNRGLAGSFPNAMLERLEVLDPLGNVVASCDESTCRTFWAAPYLYNDWFDEADWVYPANPKRSAGVWAVDWMVPFRPATAGTYTIVYSDKQIRTVADPMWATPGTVVPIYPMYDWYSWPPMTFEAE